MLDPDEFHLIKIMLNIKLTVQRETEESNFFKNDIGIPQEDGLSVNEFPFYLTRSLKDNDHVCKKSTITTLSKLPSLSKHAHCKDIDEHFAIYQEYVDHISVITNDNNIVDHIKKAVYLE